MDKELQDQLDHGNFTVIHKSTVPEGATVLPTVWAMQQKQKQDTGEVYKYKGQLNVDGSKQEKGVNFWETFAPVATWATMHTIHFGTHLDSQLEDTTDQLCAGVYTSRCPIRRSICESL